MSDKNQLQNIVTQYNDAVKNYPHQTETIFSSKYSELLGKDNAVVLQMKGIKADRDNRIKNNQQTIAEITKDRLAAQQAITKAQNTANDTLQTKDDKLITYLDNKSASTNNLINTLQDSIYTRDKTIYINNADANDKHVLIKTLLTLLLLVVVLSAIFLLHMFGLLKSNQALIAAVIVTVVFVYKIIRTYYWRETVHTMDVTADTVSASLRSLVGDKECPTCDDPVYCQEYLKEKNKNDKQFCVHNPKDICCIHDSRKSKRIYPDGVAIIDNDTNINLL